VIMQIPSLRHSFATRLIQAGVNVYPVQKLGRWKTISMVLRYGHHQPERLQRIVLSPAQAVPGHAVIMTGLWFILRCGRSATSGFQRAGDAHMTCLRERAD
jgi:hypothetical protein